MKCEHCNGNLTLEQEYCPHCGQPNKHARKHIDDMRRYQGEFEDTRRYVKDKVTGYTAISVRVVILSVLIVLCLVFIAVGSNAGRITRSIQRNKADRNFREYAQILDEYLEKGDFLEFGSFCDYKGIRTYDSAYEEKYGQIINACNWYESAFTQLMNFACFDEADRINQMTELTGDSLEYFYKYYRNDDSFYSGQDGEQELYRKTLNQMERDIELLLSVYCGFSKEEAEEFPQMSKAKRNILLEEKLEERLLNEE